MNDQMFTYQTRLQLDEASSSILEECASLYNAVEHSLFAEVARNKTSASCKNGFLKKYGITARQFNACRVNVEAKIAACRAGQDNSLVSLKAKIATIDRQITQLTKKPSKHFVIHQKKRRQLSLTHRYSKLQNDRANKRVRLCFGSKKLFRAQFHLKENHFSSHEEWKKAWTASRNNEFFILGSKDETAGNQTCTAGVNENGSISLRLRLPPALAKYGKYIHINNVFFAYGHQAILASIHDPEGRAISYRLKKDAKGWKIFVSTSLQRPIQTTQEGIGVIGIDLNADHIACVETDRFGNPVKKKVFSWISYGKSNEQLKASTAEISKQIMEWALETKKPVIIEKLDFQKKKLTLQEQKNKKLSRMLSSFAYGLFFRILLSQGYRKGILIYQVNPAFTSIIGRINYAERYGLSTHLAAALCIARRHQQFSESPNLSEGRISDGKGSHLAFDLPVRNRTKHVWHFWGQVNKKVTAVHAAHFRARRSRSSDPPSSIPATVIPENYWCNSNT
jgi:IS605 OrfB family transposase